MARYLKGNCDSFAGEIQTKLSSTRRKIQEEFDNVNFLGAQEQVMFESFNTVLLADLNNFSNKVGGYDFLLS